MNRSSSTRGFLVRPGLAPALLLAGCLTATTAAGQSSGLPPSPEIANQKARMLETFFSSYRLREALSANPDAVGPLEAEARAKLAEGRSALADGRNAEAIALFDEGMRTVSRAIAMASPKGQWDEQAATSAFEARRRHAEAYLSVIERAENVTKQESAEAAVLRAGLEKADRQFEKGDLRAASMTLDGVYREIVSFVSKIRSGRTVIVSQIFSTAEEEYEYERSRNESYELLVQITLAERGEEQPGFAELSARLGAESSKLREKAERQAAAGDFPLAIATMESATERLLVVLRASGLVMIE